MLLNNRKADSMTALTKYDQILDALQALLETRNIQHISVSEIAQKAGIGKGSIYYYFPSKDAILDALIERNYQATLTTVKTLVDQTSISPFIRMAMIFQACRDSSIEFLKRDRETDTTDMMPENAQAQAYIHQKYLKYVIAELRPGITAIIQQGIDNGEIHFDYPAELAEIVLIVLSVKMDNTLSRSTLEEIEKTLQALISLLERGTKTPPGALDYLTAL